MTFGDEYNFALTVIEYIKTHIGVTTPISYLHRTRCGIRAAFHFSLYNTQIYVTIENGILVLDELNKERITQEILHLQLMNM